MEFIVNIDRKKLAEYAAIDEADGDRWESGELGRDAAHMRVADKKTSSDLDDALDLQMISIRLEKGLLRDLKEIAAHHKLSYQPMIRDLLKRFAISEIKTILTARLEDVEKAEAVAPVAPVSEFMERRRKAG